MWETPLGQLSLSFRYSPKGKWNKRHIQVCGLANDSRRLCFMAEFEVRGRSRPSARLPPVKWPWLLCAHVRPLRSRARGLSPPPAPSIIPYLTQIFASTAVVYLLNKSTTILKKEIFVEYLICRVHIFFVYNRNSTSLQMRLKISPGLSTEKR